MWLWWVKKERCHDNNEEDKGKREQQGRVERSQRQNGKLLL
jgi:hypothetical protein